MVIYFGKLFIYAFLLSSLIFDISSQNLSEKREKFNRNKERLRTDIGYLQVLANKIAKRTDIEQDIVQAHVSKVMGQFTLYKISKF